VTDRLDPFHIVKVEQNGSVRWVRAIANLERAKLCVQKVLAIGAPADYLILNQRSGERIIIRSSPEPQLLAKVPSRTASFRN
jgi:hypothetical protein